jgi:hypothetical protein
VTGRQNADSAGRIDVTPAFDIQDVRPFGRLGEARGCRSDEGHRSAASGLQVGVRQDIGSIHGDLPVGEPKDIAAMLQKVNDGPE